MDDACFVFLVGTQRTENRERERDAAEENLNGWMFFSLGGESRIIDGKMTAGVFSRF